MTAPNLPPTKLASELKIGDHVWNASINPDMDGVSEVLFAQPFAESGTEGITVLLGSGGSYRPRALHVDLDREVRVASVEEIAQAEAWAARHQVADSLNRLADLIHNGAVPLRKGQLQISQQFADVADLAEIGEALGIEVTSDHGRFHSVEWPKGHQSYESGLHVTWFAYAEKEPDPDPTGLAYTRADSDEDDPTPVSPTREPLHTGGVVDGGQLVDETDGLICNWCEDPERPDPRFHRDGQREHEPSA